MSGIYSVASGYTPSGFHTRVESKATAPEASGDPVSTSAEPASLEASEEVVIPKFKNDDERFRWESTHTGEKYAKYWENRNKDMYDELIAIKESLTKSLGHVPEGWENVGNPQARPAYSSKENAEENAALHIRILNAAVQNFNDSLESVNQIGPLLEEGYEFAPGTKEIRYEGLAAAERFLKATIADARFSFSVKGDLVTTNENGFVSLGSFSLVRADLGFRIDVKSADAKSATTESGDVVLSAEAEAVQQGIAIGAVDTYA